MLTDTLTYIKKVGTMEPHYFDICLKRREVPCPGSSSP
jgi:hypothetical protein